MDYSERVKSSFDKQNFMKYLGAELIRIEKGFCEIHLPFNNDLTQQNNYIHAGVLGTLADTAGGYAAYSLMEPREAVLTVEYKINLLAPAVGQLLIVRSEVIKAGKTLTVCSSNAFIRNNNKELLCATATVTLISLKDYKTNNRPPEIEKSG